MSAAPLSSTMRAAIAHALKHRGSLVRLAGGYWVGERDADSHPQSVGGVTYFGTATVDALVSRRLASYTERRAGRMGEFPVRLTLLPAAQEALNAPQ